MKTMRDAVQREFDNHCSARRHVSAREFRRGGDVSDRGAGRHTRQSHDGGRRGDSFALARTTDVRIRPISFRSV